MNLLVHQRTRQQIDLFGQPLLPGLSSFDDAISEADERALIAEIDSAALTPFQFQGFEGKRLTTSFGWSYDFTSGVFAPSEPIPDWLLPLRSTAAKFVGLADEDFVQALLIRYNPGAGIGWHRDRPVFGHIVGMSLGAPATMRLRRRRMEKFDRASFDLKPRALYHLTGEVRHEWEHSIAPMDARRWSITFRTLASVGRQS